MTRVLGRSRLSPLTIAGVALVVGGLACLGWVGYQYVGTNFVSARAFQTEREDTRARWSSSAPASPADAQPMQTAAPGEVIALLRIPAFGSDYEIPILSGTDAEILARGVGHYASTAQPGQIGNFSIAGHRVTNGEPFSRLLELNAGEQIVVETQDATYTYVLDTAPRDLTVKDTDTWVIDPVPGKPDQAPSQSLITLTTCQDLFHSADRTVAFGHLASTLNK